MHFMDIELVLQHRHLTRQHTNATLCASKAVHAVCVRALASVCKCPAWMHRIAARMSDCADAV